MELEKTELKALLFWAIVGLSNSNGGSYAKKIPIIIKKYAKSCGFGGGDCPFINTQQKGILTGNTGKEIIEALKIVYPKTNF